MYSVHAINLQSINLLHSFPIYIHNLYAFTYVKLLDRIIEGVCVCVFEYLWVCYL